jgi:hypothetical protein
MVEGVGNERGVGRTGSGIFARGNWMFHLILIYVVDNLCQSNGFLSRPIFKFIVEFEIVARRVYRHLTCGIFCGEK